MTFVTSGRVGPAYQGDRRKTSRAGPDPLPTRAARRMETTMKYLLYPFVIAIGLFVAILSAATATL